MRRMRRHLSFSNVVSVIALFVALGGTGAYATHLVVDSSDVVDESLTGADVQGSPTVNGSLTTYDLADGAVTPKKANLLGYAEVAAEESTTSSSPTDLATVGPEVQVEVPANGLVAIFASVKIVSVGAGGGVYLYEPTVFPQGVLILRVSAPHTAYTAPGTFGGVRIGAFAGWLVFPVAPGTRTFRLRYRDGTFKNRKLWVMAIG